MLTSRNLSPALLVILILALAGCAGSGGSQNAAYTISGRVTLNGAGFAGATVSLDGAAVRSTSTDPSGHYSFTGLAEGDYNVKTAVAGQRVNPSARSLAVYGASVAAADFVLVTYELNGSVVQGGHGYPGATVTLKQAGNPDMAAVTGWGGDYSFSGLLNGSYTLDAAKSGQTFTPGFTNPVTIADAALSGLDFLLDTYDATGKVELAGGDWTGGGTAVLTGDLTLVTDLDAAGNYAFRGLPNGGYLIKVYATGQAVTPSSRSVAIAGGDQVAETFALVTHSLTGCVTARGLGQAGVTVTLAGTAAETVLSGSDGAFAFSRLINGTYSVTPSLAGGSFLPPSRSTVVVFNGDPSGNDFLLLVSPDVTTQSPDYVTPTSGMARGLVNPNGSAATGWFEWGTDPALASPVETDHIPLGSGTTPVSYSFNLPGLTPGVNYYFRAVGVNSAGTARGSIDFFMTDTQDDTAIVVNSLEDLEYPPAGKTTLRSAMRRLDPGGVIAFDPSLNGSTIGLVKVGSSHSVLMGEVYSGMTFLGYAERDYGPSGLYTAKNLTLDASALPEGITVAWAGGDSNRARVMAVYGDLTMRNVNISSGFSSAQPIIGGTQPYTLARGGGLAVWGIATLDHVTVSGCKAAGDPNGSRDRGTYGGGIFANALVMNDCVVAGNSAVGYGAAGGGIYSVGGADAWGNDSILTGCTVSGNRVTAQHAYGGGIFTLGGGPDNLMALRLTNCTIARNLVEDNPALPQAGQYYYRGGGVYMGGGYLEVTSCTVAENEVTGYPAVFSGKPNMGGGGMAATIGNAHVVEDMKVRHSIIAGNKLNGAAEDLFTGSLLDFYSLGYNLIGRIDFSQILVPVPSWLCLSRKHWPKIGDQHGVEVSQVLDLANIARHPSMTSVGTDAGQGAVLWYPPSGTAVDQIPVEEYSVDFIWAEYYVAYGLTDDFLNHVLAKLRSDDYLGSGFGPGFGDMTNVTFNGEPVTWPTNPVNFPWIQFWRDLDAAIGDSLGPAKLADDFWGSFPSGPLGDYIEFYQVPGTNGPVALSSTDQLGHPRPYNLLGDIGAVEKEGL